MFRAGFVGFIGLPNAGKSTLLNALVDEKVAIVSPKPQTTRRRHLGIVTLKQGQVVLVDAPGLVRADRGLNAFLRQEAEEVMAESDVLLAVLNTDASSPEVLEEVVQLVHRSGKPWFVVLTKVDLPEYARRREKMESLFAPLTQKDGEPVRSLEFSSSWSQADLVDFKARFWECALALLPEMPAPLYDPELFTPHTQRELVAELIREQCFLQLEQELPYSLAVRIRSFQETTKPLRIEADIVVAKENHKAMVIGRGGQMIKKIGQAARGEIERLLGEPCFLGLHVVVRENWMSNPLMMRDLGYRLNTKKE
ncbi:MAG: GTPase Era [Bdellovibrionaceae bacterium]|jgi:GTP-binding protein Era|nr:GTPase Era [Pseudobdellovibrionaceae bacterium]